MILQYANEILTFNELPSPPQPPPHPQQYKIQTYLEHDDITSSQSLSLYFLNFLHLSFWKGMASFFDGIAVVL